ncbi:MAG: MFS transporter [Desulfobulbaceae bacterium]|nr:MFS transporter [Desulfobulbaceae bacterium]
MRDHAPKTIFAWCLYDWANSAFTTIVVTFVYATYFTKAIAPDPATGTLLWSRAIGLSGILVALLSPVLGGLADRHGRRKRGLLAATLLCVAATAALTFVHPDQPLAIPLALAIFVVANVAYELGIVFYNAFLPDLAPPGKIGAISGYGWGLGYAGGIACMAIALYGLVCEQPLFGIATARGFNIRATNLLVAGWFLLFSLPLLACLREQPPPRQAGPACSTIARCRQTWRDLRAYRETLKFLLARLLYNDGLVTVFAFGGIYAAGTFGMTMREVMLFGIVINIAAGLGALAFGYLDDAVGGKRTIQISNVALGLATLLAVFAPDKAWFWAAAVLIGIFVGPNQSASRSLMGRFVPPRHQAEFYGFFSFSGKISSFAGPLLLGTVTAATQSQRAGVATILLFLVAGGLLLQTVDEKQGIAAAAMPTTPD